MARKKTTPMNTEQSPEIISAPIVEQSPEVVSTPAAPKTWTLEELLEEHGLTGKKLDGGTLARLQRELRRRNRKAERGY